MKHYYDKRNTLEEELRKVHESIDNHPFNSHDLQAAQKLIEHRKTETSDTDKINEELRAENLPTIEQVGKSSITSGLNWWKLHRKKNKLEKKLSAL